jgi:hypothetical protein
MEISQAGGVFAAHIPYNSEDDKAIKKMNEQVKDFGLKHGAAHTEFIKVMKTVKYTFWKHHE